MNKKALVIMAEGFEEIETVTIVDVFRRAGIDVVSAGLKAGPLTGSRKIVVVPDTELDKVIDDDFDLVVLPGGQPGVDNLRRDERVLKLLQTRDAQELLTAAICAAPLILRDAGITRELKLTSYPGMKDEFADSEYREERIVCDGHFMTSRGPGTAMEFALALVETLMGSETALEVEQRLLPQVKTIQG